VSTEKASRASHDFEDSFEHPPKIISHFQDGEENSDGDLSSSMMTTATVGCIYIKYQDIILFLKST
jgi:hypothetical protein